MDKYTDSGNVLQYYEQDEGTWRVIKIDQSKGSGMSGDKAHPMLGRGTWWSHVVPSVSGEAQSWVICFAILDITGG